MTFTLKTQYNRHARKVTALNRKAFTSFSGASLEVSVIVTSTLVDENSLVCTEFERDLI